MNSAVALRPIRKKGAALAPTQGINGEVLANLADFGDAHPDVIAGTNPALNIFPRNPQLLPLLSGTILAGWTNVLYGGNDNTADSHSVSASLDGGKTWSAPVALVSVAGFVASLGAGHNALNGWGWAQLSNGTIVLVYSLQPYLSNAGGGWYDFSGNTPPQSQGVKLYVVTFTESSGVLTVASGPTEITSSVIILDDRNNMNVSAVATTGTPHYRITVSANSDAIATGSYYRVRLAGFGGTDGAALNYGTNGSKAIYAKGVNSTTLDLQTYADGSALPTGTASVSGATASPEYSWMSIASGGSIRIRNGANAGNLVFPFYGRWGTAPDGTASGFGLYTPDGSTFSVTSQTTLNTTIAEIEPCIAEQSTGGLLMIMRQGSGSNRLKKTASVGSWTWGTQASVTEFSSTATLGTTVNVGGANIVAISPGDTVHRSRLTAWLSSNDGSTWPNKRVLNWDASAYSGCCYANGTILCGFERDYADFGFSDSSGRIGLVRTNAAAIKQAANQPDEIRYYFNDLPSGFTAWTGGNCVRDWGNLTTGACFNHHGVVRGVPVYASGGLVFNGSTDYLTLSSGSVNDSFYGPDYLASDNGSFMLEVEFTIAASGTGVIASHGGSTVGTSVGAGSKGWKLIVAAGGAAQIIVDDGTNHFLTSSGGTANVNDGTTYRLVCTWTGGAAVGPTMQIYNATTGALLGTQLGSAGTALGTISNTTHDTNLLQYYDTSTGRMNQNITFRMFRFIRCSTTQAMLPVPL